MSQIKKMVNTISQSFGYQNFRTYLKEFQGEVKKEQQQKKKKSVEQTHLNRLGNSSNSLQLLCKQFCNPRRGALLLIGHSPFEIERLHEQNEHWSSIMFGVRSLLVIYKRNCIHTKSSFGKLNFNLAFYLFNWQKSMIPYKNLEFNKLQMPILFNLLSDQSTLTSSIEFSWQWLRFAEHVHFTIHGPRVMQSIAFFHHFSSRPDIFFFGYIFSSFSVLPILLIVNNLWMVIFG